MLAVGANQFNFMYTNQDVAASAGSSFGTSVVPGASDAEGDWTEVASAANISSDIFLLELYIFGGSSSGQIKDHLLDIGTDPAGGTSYSAIISNIICGSSVGLAASSNSYGRFYLFPIFIKAGSAVAVRVQGSNATAGTVRVGVKFWGKPSHPEFCKYGQYSETIGTITGSAGVSFTPANGSEGDWASLGTTTRALWWFQLCVQCTTSSGSNLIYHFDLAYGDSSNKHMIIENFMVLQNAGTEAIAHFVPSSCSCEVPAGAELWVRGSSGGNPASGWNAVAVGIGG